MSRILFTLTTLFFTFSSLCANDVHLKPLTAPPLVFGGIDTNKAQINFWGRGDGSILTISQMLAPTPFSVYGVARISLAHSATPLKTVKFKMDEDDDYIGTSVINDLRPGKYTYSIGYCALKPTELDKNFDFSECQTGSFHIADPRSDYFSFVFGSCRLYTKLWKLTLFGTGKKADKVFKAIVDDIDEQSNDGIETEFFMNVGDHVYYDQVGPVFRLKTLNKMRRRYRKVRSYKHLNNLLRSTQFFAMGDDHDMHVDNSNWRRRHEEPEVFKAGMKAYKEYQHPGGPADDTDHMWYSFSRDIADFFVLDTRSERDERYIDDQSRPKKPTLISAAQFKAFRKWITSPNRNGRVVFVVTPVSLAGEDNMDGWMGCPEQQKTMLKLIADKPNTFILTGDSHGTRCDSYDVFDENDNLLGNVTELMSSGLKSVTFAIPENFPKNLNLTSNGGVRFERTSTVGLYPYNSRSKAHQNWLMKRIGTYVKGVFMRVTIDKTTSKLNAIIHDENMDNPMTTSYNLNLDYEDDPDAATESTEEADVVDSDDDSLELASAPRTQKNAVRKRTKRVRIKTRKRKHVRS